MTPKSTVKVIDYYFDYPVGTEVPNTNPLKFWASALPHIYCISETILIQLQCKNKMKSSLLQFLTNIVIIMIIIAAPPFKLNCCLALQSSFPASTSVLVLENYVFVTERQKDRTKKTERQRCSHRIVSTSNFVFVTAVTTTTIVTKTMIMMVAIIITTVMIFTKSVCAKTVK